VERFDRRRLLPAVAGALAQARLVPPKAALAHLDRARDARPRGCLIRLLFLSADPGVPVLGHKGASVHVRELICALAALGAEMHVASPRIGWEGDALEAPATMHGIPGVLPKRRTEAELV